MTALVEAVKRGGYLEQVDNWGMSLATAYPGPVLYPLCFLDRTCSAAMMD